MIGQALEKQYPEINVSELAGTDFGAVYNRYVIFPSEHCEATRLCNVVLKKVSETT